MELSGGNYQRRTQQRDQHLTTAVVCSLLLHLLFLSGFTLNKTALPPQPIEVTLRQFPAERPQIVSPSDTSDSTPPESARLRSEKDSSAVVEQLRRGVEDGGPVTGEDKQQAEPQQATEASEPILKMVEPTKPQSKEQDEPKTEPKIEPKKSETPKQPAPQLRLSAEDIEKNVPFEAIESETGDLQLAKKVEDSKQKPENEQIEVSTDKERAQLFMRAEPFKKQQSATASRAYFGSSDYLPNLPDGDITLLNAKADRFAVFVRRVALQVFGSIRRRNWAELPRSEIGRIMGYTTIHAIMSREGKLLSVNIKDSSGSSYFDKVVSASAKDGAWDQNPPPDAAAADGNIHFVFRSRTWSAGAPGRGGERRWILLGTGLL